MPAQKRPSPEAPREENEVEREHPLRNHQYAPPQLNGDNHPPLYLLSLPAPSEHDAAWKPADDEEEDAGEDVPKGEDDDDEHHRPNEDDDVEADEESPGPDAVLQDPKMEECDDENGTEEWKQTREYDSDDSSSSNNEQKPEYVYVELAEIRKEVQCPICLGIIKKTRTVMECLHRFCRECIDKSMRMGNNECPACRTHCASRRSLRDDPNYDALIAALYPDIDKYEEEELAFHEEEKTRNKQIQASIAQIFQRQSEALARRRTMGKEAIGAFSGRSQRRPTRRRQNRGSEFVLSEDENEEKALKDSSSADERSTEGRQRRRKKRRSSQPSTSADREGGSNENEVDTRGVSPGLTWNTEMLAWGGGGARSHTRHGNSSSGNNKNSRTTRLSKLVDHLKNADDKQETATLNLRLIATDSEATPMLLHPYLSCKPTLSIKSLCEYVALQTPYRAEDVEILLLKGQPCPSPDFQILNHQQTLADLRTVCVTSKGYLILAYRMRENNI